MSEKGVAAMKAYAALSPEEKKAHLAAKAEKEKADARERSAKRKKRKAVVGGKKGAARRKIEQTGQHSPQQKEAIKQANPTVNHERYAQAGLELASAKEVAKEVAGAFLSGDLSKIAQVQEKIESGALPESALQELDIEQRRKAMRALSERKAREEIEKEGDIDAKSEAQKEFAQRVLAKRRLIEYIRRFQPGYDAGWVHLDICRRLEKFLDEVAAGLAPRLMLCMPPRHGKSLIASNHFPSFALGHYPHFEIIAASYAVSLPLGFSRKVRARVRDDTAYQAMFPETRLNMEAQSAEGWETTKGGGYVPAGVGGGITGKGAHILIIDDPVKDADEADSATIRENTWDWWGATAKTRLAPGGGVLVIQTRWHDDDLAGRLLQQQVELEKEAGEMVKEGLLMMDANQPDSKLHKEGEDYIRQAEEMKTEIDRWELVNYPALAVQDEYLLADTYEVVSQRPRDGTRYSRLRLKDDSLHPARFPRGRLMNMKRTMQPRHWSALYQQNPVPDEGLYFTKDMFRFRSALPYSPRANEVRLMAVDLAITDKQVNDRTSLAVGVYGWDRSISVPEVIYGRWTTYQIVDAICNAIQRWDIEVLGIENGQLKHAIMPILLDELASRELSVAFDDSLTPITDKSARNRGLQGMMQQGRWHYINSDTWFPVVQQEMLRFPGGVRDDNVDSQGWLARMVSNISAPARPTTTAEGSSWRTKLGRMMADQTTGRDDGGYLGA